ncbi:cation:proton antiporter subunit C [Corynebacterium mastitidis]|uniref:Cation:proton antiporter n=1 Tax=Corynebacterium mastitidis TaxID=161890 RepID=A0A2N0X9C8_9CORY|nr:cation:proton antiporter subunit C [Corynebacterium mastitidis]MCH6197237.1 cation:proton antiporter subunit C [Corynebacterium mastitidis]MDK8450437.1 cation:proton antiporter subunit C [Corynebacterium mastitidis]PKF69277.1 cation:proton antiporter [Corynebacterium mastitidis]
MIMALTIAVLVTGGVYLTQQRGMVRIVFGMQLIGHAANLMLLATGVGAWRGEVFLDRVDAAEVADPLPQAFVLTAIVISMATTTILLTLAALGRSDDTVSVDPVSSGEEPHPSPVSTLGRATQSPEEFRSGERARRRAHATLLADKKEGRR